MRQLIVTEWVSLDGIFDAASFEEWFNPYHSDSRVKYIQNTIRECEILLYGRITYEMLYPYWSSLKNNEMGVAEKLNKAKKYVVSATMTEAPWEDTTIIDRNVVETIRAIKQETGGDILVQGSGHLLQSLLEAGLVDELKLLVHPHTAGTGKRLFDKRSTFGFELVSSEQLEKGVVGLIYRPVGNRDAG
jgi:dihydrofolate reductase